MSPFKCAINWRPIETAPKKHSEPLLLCCGPYRPCIGMWWQPDPEHQGRWVSEDPEGRFESDAEFEAYLHGSRYDPTHWAPMIEGPEEYRS